MRHAIGARNGNWGGAQMREYLQGRTSANAPTDREQALDEIKQALGPEPFENWYRGVYALRKTGNQTEYEFQVFKKLEEIKAQPDSFFGTQLEKGITPMNIIERSKHINISESRSSLGTSYIVIIQRGERPARIYSTKNRKRVEAIKQITYLTPYCGGWRQYPVPSGAVVSRPFRDLVSRQCDGKFQK